MFRTSNPVTAKDFYDREGELADLQGRVEKLRRGAPAWVAIVGRRKVGKTSLLLELKRRAGAPKVLFVVIDSFEAAVPSLDIVRRYALRTVDAALGVALGLSLEALAGRPAEYRVALQRSRAFGSLPPELRDLLLELPERELDDDHLRACLDLPERIATARRCHVVVAWDEFQALAELRAGKLDLLPLIRSIWQRHRRVGYIISGSERTMLTSLVTSQHSPFFQHFSLMELGGLPHGDAVRLLRAGGPPEHPVPAAIAERAVEILGGHPFYLQLLGEELTRSPPPYDEAALKQALQGLLFSRTGRLALYLEGEYRVLVGRAASLAATLQALAEGPLRHGEIAQRTGVASGAVARYLERLGDAITVQADGRYALSDPVFGLWLRWRSPGGTVVPMGVIGDEAEREVAAELARAGFDLVYQSRASRGAFDLLATRGAHQLGVQVKRAGLPVRFDAAAWSRLHAEAARFGWRWIVAVVTPAPSHRVLMLDPDRVEGQRARRLGEAAVIDNLPLWLEGARQTTDQDS